MQFRFCYFRSFARMEERSKLRCTAAKTGPLSSGKQASSGTRCWVIAIGVLMVILVLLSSYILFLSVISQKRSTLVAYKSGSHLNQSRYQGYSGRKERKEEEHIEIVGDGHRYLNLGIGTRLCHWKLSTRTGHVRLKYHTFIVIQIPGLYCVYGQYAVYKPSGENKAMQRISVALMQNRTELSTSAIEQCEHICTRSFSKTVHAKEGDHLSLQSGTGGKFFWNSKLSYFGVNKLN